MPSPISYPPRSRAAFSLSVIAHAAAIAIAVWFGGSVRQFTAQQRAALVLAPAATRPPRREARSLPLPRQRRPLTAPRAFRIPRPAEPTLLPPAPVIDPSRRLPEPEIRTEEVAVAPPPVARTGSFEPQRVVPKAHAAASAPVLPATPFTPVASVAAPTAPGRIATVGVFGVPVAESLAGRPAKLQLPVGSVFGSPDVAASENAKGHMTGPPVQASGFAASIAAPARRPDPKPPIAPAEKFDQVTVAAPAKAAAPHRAETSSPMRPVEILEKPRPAYTEEARRLHIEGEVLVEVLFAASGEIRVGRIVQSLGHGLDEAAVTAARGIKFRPAMRGGQSADATATVHIVFQLAF